MQVSLQSRSSNIQAFQALHRVLGLVVFVVTLCFGTIFIVDIVLGRVTLLQYTSASLLDTTLKPVPPRQNIVVMGVTHLFPHCRSTLKTFVDVLLWLRLVTLDDSPVQLRLVHVVDSFTSVFWEGELDVAEASVRIC